MLSVGSKTWWGADIGGVTPGGAPRVVGPLPGDVVAEVAARYGARVSMGYTPEDQLQLPYRDWIGRVAAAEVSQAVAKAAAAGVPKPEPSPKSAVAKRRRAVAQTAAIAERTERVRLALARGLTLPQVAAETGLSCAAVGKASLRLLNAGQRPPTPRQARIAYCRAETARMLAEGASFQAIADHLGVPKRCVYSYKPKAVEGATCAPS